MASKGRNHPVTPLGFRLFADQLDADAQGELVAEVMRAQEAAPFYRPITPGGRAMSVMMTNFGDLGWVTDKAGYRYQAMHPLTGAPWPPIPPSLLKLWSALADATTPPDVCLVNLYDKGARMGLHQDRDEADFGFPVLSVSLGDTAIFRIGGAARATPTATVRLCSGDVCMLGGEARLAFHGIDRIVVGTSRLIPGGGRLNLTLRRAALAI